MPRPRGERRKYPRVPLNLLIQYRFERFEDFIAEYAANLSEGGMFIRSEDAHDEGTMVRTADRSGYAHRRRCARLRPALR